MTARTEEPWDGSVVPPGYELNHQGLFHLPERGSRRQIAGPVWVPATTRSKGGDNWGVLVDWLDQDGHMRTLAVPAGRLHKPGNDLAAELAQRGLKIVNAKQLIGYLLSCEPDTRVDCVQYLGWLSERETLAYVLPPHRVLGADDRRVVFQPDGYAPSAETIYAQGGLEAWQRNVANMCKGNPVLVFALAAAFAGPLLRFTSCGSCGFHFFGQSSRGKTTALQVAASVWGNGCDPGTGAKPYVQNWNTTGNALEGLAAAHNDGLLTLDEIAQSDGFDFGKTVYNLMNGQGKSRMTQEAAIRQRRSWLHVVLSSGEISIQQKIREGNQIAKEGQKNRLLDVPVGALIVDAHMLTPGAFANKLKESCGRFFGEAGPAFLLRLIEAHESPSALRNALDRMLGDARQQLAPAAQLETFQARAIERIALVLAAGRLATKLGVLPLSGSELEAAARFVRDAFLNCHANIPVAHRGVENIREFIRQHGRMRFERVQSCESRQAFPLRDCAGYYDKRVGKDGAYLFFPSAFDEACAGVDPATVVAELTARGLLHKNDVTRARFRYTTPTGERERLFAVRTEILNEWEEEAPARMTGTTGTAGTGP